MRTIESPPQHVRRIGCPACAGHMHPEMVPWLQHAIGCPVRTAELRRYNDAPDLYAARRAKASAGSY